MKDGLEQLKAQGIEGSRSRIPASRSVPRCDPATNASADLDPAEMNTAQAAAAECPLISPGVSRGSGSIHH